MKLSTKFITVNAVALTYATISFLLAQWWIAGLTDVFGNSLFAYLTVFFIAIIPGYLNILILFSLMMYDFEPPKVDRKDFPSITLLVPMYNEADVIKETFRGILQQEYPNNIEIIVVDDGSTDNTAEELNKLNLDNLRIIHAAHGGKAEALNLGLKESSNEIIVTIDADTFLHKNAVKHIVARLLDNPECAAVAGHVLVKNERASRLVRIQTWDYALGISSAKRQQGLFRGILVAQGAFSVFRKEPLIAVKGWWDRLGEDIVLTWALLNQGYQVEYEPTAFAFTQAPTHYTDFYRQRQRWARGMIEGFKDHISIIWKGKGYSSFFIGIDLFFPLIDFFYTFVFIPGIILAFFGFYYIVGLITLLVIPINICINVIMFKSQQRFMQYAGLKLRHNPLAIVFYVLVYQIIMSPVCVLGYFKEIFNFSKKW